MLEFHYEVLADAPEQLRVLDAQCGGAVVVVFELIRSTRHLRHDLRIVGVETDVVVVADVHACEVAGVEVSHVHLLLGEESTLDDRSESTRLNSSHTVISYAVFCLKKKNILNSRLIQSMIRHFIDEIITLSTLY